MKTKTKQINLEEVREQLHGKLDGHNHCGTAQVVCPPQVATYHDHEVIVQGMLQELGLRQDRIRYLRRELENTQVRNLQNEEKLWEENSHLRRMRLQLANELGELRKAAKAKRKS